MYLPEKKAEEVFCTYGLPAAGEKIIIGVSGGADSVALLRVMAVLAEKYSWKLTAVHVEHGIRGEAALADAAWVQNLCDGLRVTAAIFHEDVPAYAAEKHLTEEEAGRKIRYRRFYEVLKKENASRIAVAHNANDNAETMLLDLVRGTGLDGLRGIPAVRNEIIRPLIEVQRDEIIDYLETLHQDWREDATNTSDVYARNRIRLHVLPELQKINSMAIAHMNQTAGFVSEAEAFIADHAKALLTRVMIDPNDPDCCYEQLTPKKSMAAGILRLDLAQEPSSFLRREVLHLWISETSEQGKDITAAHLYALEDLLFGQTGRRVDLPYGLTAVRGYETLQLIRHEKNAVSTETESKSISCGLSIGSCGELSIGKYRFFYQVRECSGPGDYSQNIYTKTFDYDKIKCDISLRYRLPGDRITINARGASQSLKKYFINAKVPRGLRDDIPVFACKEEVLFVAGMRSSSGFLVDGDTRVILEIQEKSHE